MVEYAQAPLDRVFHALADPTRRAVLARLARGPARVTAIAAPFASSLNAVSKHLRVLEGAGLIRRTRVGREHHCALSAAPLRGASAWLAHYTQFWSDRLDALEALVGRPPAAPASTPRVRRAPRRGAPRGRKR